jgi:hypothetical protein
MLHDELLKRGHDLFAVVDRQTNFARCKPLKSFIDLQLRPLDFATSGPSIVTIHSIAASLKPAIFSQRSWLRFPIPRHPRVFAALVESNETS